MSLRVVIDHCVIAVSDWNRSNAFYRDVLGAELVARGNGYVYRFGGQYLSVHGPEDDVPYTAREPVRPGNSDLCFEWPGTIEEGLNTSVLTASRWRRGRWARRARSDEMAGTSTSVIPMAVSWSLCRTRRGAARFANLS